MYSIDLEPNNPELLVLLMKYYYTLDNLEHLKEEIKRNCQYILVASLIWKDRHEWVQDKF